jgi:hypothetical protein
LFIKDSKRFAKKFIKGKADITQREVTTNTTKNEYTWAS